MKKLLVIALLAVFVWACNKSAPEQTGYTIKGMVEDYDSGAVFLKKREAGEWISVDSTESDKGKFTFKGVVESPEMYYLFFGQGQKISALFLENSDITFSVKTTDLRNPQVKGSKANDAYSQFTDETKAFEDKLKNLYQEYMAAQKDDNKELLAQIDSTYEVINNDKTDFVKSYIGTNNKSVATPYILFRELSYSVDVNELDSLFGLLDSSLSVSPYYQIVDKKIKVLRNVEIGKPAPDFTLNDTLGNPISLSSLKGQYVLIDFWAAWCRPCRAENPNNVKLYAKYHDKGFEIFGVSFDDTHEAWVKAIKKDGLTWPQVSDLKGWSSAAGKLYGVSAIPHTVLLDKKGIIVANNLRGEELNKEIAKLLD